MAKKQTFGDKVRRRKQDIKRMAKIVVAEKKSNGQYRFRDKMVAVDDVQEELKSLRS